MQQSNGWRKTTVTIGLLITLVAGTAVVVGFGFKALGGMEDVAEKRMLEHREKDIDLSHPMLKTKYTSDPAFRDTVGQIKGDIREIKHDVAQIKEDMKTLTSIRRSARGPYR